jgi:hypothetical protein
VEHGRSHNDAFVTKVNRSLQEDDLLGRLYGVYYARVTNINDPDKQNRVKVRYHFLEDDDSGPMESGWITRLVPTGLGPTNAKRGRKFGVSFAQAEVGSLVAIQFVAGNPHDAVIVGMPEYSEGGLDASNMEKDSKIDWAFRMGFQNGSEWGFDTEGNCYFNITGNLRIKVLGSTFLSAMGVLSAFGTHVRVVSRSVLRLLGTTVDQTNYPRPDEAAEVRQMCIDAYQFPPGRKDSGIGQIDDLVDDA